MVAGVSDLCYLTEQGKPIFIELKVGSNTQSEAQIKFEQVCSDLQIGYYVIKNFKDFCNLLESFM